MPPTRSQLADEIATRLRTHGDRLRADWSAAEPFAHFALDACLPPGVAEDLAARFPGHAQLMARDTLRERKRVGVDVERYDPAIGEALFAFQQPAVVEAIAAIMGIRGLEPDPTLYASGLSSMGPGDFLQPHLDNSHDGDGIRYRALNVLFYLTPDWRDDEGGALELWDEGVERALPLAPRFGRMVVMATDAHSWHSVARVRSQRERRCVSNYYFTREAPGGWPYRHVTSFAGRPEQRLRRAWLRADSAARNVLGRALPFLLRRSRHRRRE